MNTKQTTLLIILLLVIQSFWAQQKNKKWDVNNPHKDWKYKNFTLDTNEGTWMNLDVSPDGKTIVFDMLGDIYKMPITGGKATPIREGLAYEVQPRFGPDGKYISFTSDLGGGDNIWIMTADGKEAKAITKESFRLLNNAVWTPDGKSIIAKKHFTSSRSIGSGEMWQYFFSGKSGIQLTKKKNAQQDVNDPSVSPDGRYVYYDEDVYPGGYFQYNKDPNKQIYVINRYDLQTGKIERVTGGSGGAARPVISRDGKLLAFVKRVRTKSVLYIHNLETGEETPINFDLSKDQQEAWAIYGVYPYFSWLPNNKEIVIWSQGKINKINIETKAVSNIPFQIKQQRKIAKTHRAKRKVFSNEITAKMIKHAKTSPDGKTLVFTALGYLYKKELPNGIPQRITNGSDFEAEPSFSKNGKKIVFVTWNDENMGAIYEVNLDGTQLKKLSAKKGIYRMPSYNNDATKITYKKENGNGDQGYDHTKKTGLFVLDLKTDKDTRIAKSGDYPMFSVDGKRVFYQTGGTFFGNLTKHLKSVDTHGHDEKAHFKSKHANRIVPSPDNNWVAVIHLHKVYMAPFVKNGKEINLDVKSGSFKVESLSDEAGINIHWGAKNDKIHWTLGDEYFTKNIIDNTKNPFKATNLATEKDSSIKVGLSAKSDKPTGRIAFTNARIITMENDKVFENATIIINENKIEKLGVNITIPSDAKVYDMKGKTIMPGLVDVHAHIGAFRNGLSTQNHWQFYANLAFGVTTAHDPSVNTEGAFTLKELQLTGKTVGASYVFYWFYFIRSRRRF